MIEKSGKSFTLKGESEAGLKKEIQAYMDHANEVRGFTETFSSAKQLPEKSSFHKCASCVAFHVFHYTVKEGGWFGRANMRVEVMVTIPLKTETERKFLLVCKAGLPVW